MYAVVIEEGRCLVEFGLEGLTGGRDEPEVVSVGQRVQALAVSELDVRGVIVEPAEQRVHPGDELEGAEQAALAHAGLLNEGVREAVCRDHGGEGA